MNSNHLSQREKDLDEIVEECERFYPCREAFKMGLPLPNEFVIMVRSAWRKKYGSGTSTNTNQIDLC